MKTEPKDNLLRDINNAQIDIIKDFSRLQADVSRLSEANILFAQDNIKLRQEVKLAKCENARMRKAAYWLARSCKDRLPSGHFAKLDEEYDAVMAIILSNAEVSHD